MSKLKAATRKRIPSKDFGLPNERKYPEQNRAHAIDAKARAKAQWETGRLSTAEYKRIVAKANDKLKH